MRDAIEVVNTSEYPKFLSAFLPAFGAVLDAVPAQTEDNVEHKVRKTVLEMLNKLPHNEHLRPHDKTVLAMATKALRAENEENALVCLRVIFDLHRNFRPSLEFEVEPFLEFVRSVYENVEETVKATFGEPGAGAETTKEKKKGEKDAEAPSAVATLSTRSFKVQTECPLIVMLLFQLYARLIPANVTALLPLMVKMIGLKGPDLKDVPNRLRGAYGDLKGAQVKTVSFVTYLLRGYAESVQPHRDAVSVSIVELLRSCPDNVSTRKELLVATRHVLSAPDFRRGFFAHLDALLDEETLVGDGAACRDALRPLAYSFLAELVHHMRLELSMAQIRRAVYLFSRNVQDGTLPLSIQMTCVRLMHHLVESIFRRRNDPAQAADARANLVRILDATVAKFGTVKPQVKLLLENGKKAEAAELEEAKKSQASQDAALGVAPAPVLKKDVKDAKDAKDAEKSEDASKALIGYDGAVQTPADALKSLADTKALVKTLVIGMKTLFWSITNFHGNAQQAQAQAPKPKGFRCLALFQGSECAEMCTHFGEALAVLDPRSFLDIICLRLDALLGGGEPYELAPMVQLPHILLQSPALGRSFAAALATQLSGEDA